MNFNQSDTFISDFMTIKMIMSTDVNIKHGNTFTII